MLTAAARQYPSLSHRPYLTRTQRREQLLRGGAVAQPAAAAVSAGAGVAAGVAAVSAAVQPAAAVSTVSAVSVTAAGVWRPLAEQLALPELHPPGCLPRGNVGCKNPNLNPNPNPSPIPIPDPNPNPDLHPNPDLNPNPNGLKRRLGLQPHATHAATPCVQVGTPSAELAQLVSTGGG